MSSFIYFIKTKLSIVHLLYSFGINSNIRIKTSRGKTCLVSHIGVVIPNPIDATIKLSPKIYNAGY